MADAVGKKPAADTPRSLRNRAQLKPPARYDVDVAEFVPATYQEAVGGEDATQWAIAIEEELRAHKENRTWSVVPRTPSMKTIDSKWVFKIKTDPEKTSKHFKARLCARGFMQRHGIDYNETFAPVRYDSLRVLLAIATQDDLELMQFDVRTAFLYGEIDEDIYMEVPEGLIVGEDSAEEEARVVCKLEKSIYGLKQSPRCWNQKFTTFLHEFEFRECEADKCVFVGKVNNEKVYLALFVDDSIAGNVKDNIKKTAR